LEGGKVSTIWLYDVTNSGEVVRKVEIDPDGSLNWDSVAAASSPGEYIGRNSLVEGKFPTDSERRSSATKLFEEIPHETFEWWFSAAQAFGRRRTHAQMVAEFDKRRNTAKLGE
jgi:hypothetical protein